MASNVVIYGSNWCGYTIRALQLLDELGIDYRYVDVDSSPEDEERIAQWNNGRSIRPTLELGGVVFVNPSLDTLQAELETLDCCED